MIPTVAIIYQSCVDSPIAEIYEYIQTVHYYETSARCCNIGTSLVKVPAQISRDKATRTGE